MTYTRAEKGAQLRACVYTAVPPGMLVWTIRSASIPAEIPGSMFIRFPEGTFQCRVFPHFPEHFFSLFSLCYTSYWMLLFQGIVWSREVSKRREQREEEGLREVCKLQSQHGFVGPPCPSVSAATETAAPCPRDPALVTLPLISGPHVLTCAAFY